MKLGVILLILILIVLAVGIFFLVKPGAIDSIEEVVKDFFGDGSEETNGGEEGLGQAGIENNGAGNNGGGSGNGGGGEDSNGEELPSDLYTNECGFYFVDYGVCAGTCPAGTCQQEGNSCYCKLS